MPARILLAFAGLVAVVLLQEGQAQQKAAEIGGVMERATQWVAQYEEHQLGNLIASETYTQKVVFLDSDSRIVRTELLKTKSDFLIAEVGGVRFGIRKVDEINGYPEKIEEPSFEEMLDDSLAGRDKLMAALRKGSSIHSTGCVSRTIDLPTFALEVARRSEASRFTFEKRGTDKIGGIQTWEVRFGKEREPTLVHAKEGGQALPSSGTLWIEPDTGRIMKTELLIDNPYSKPPVKSRIVVTYKVDKNLGMSVPNDMTEHYETKVCSVDGLALYSNFRTGQVTVKIDVEPFKVPTQR